MRQFWQRFLPALTPGVQTLIGLLTLSYLAALVGSWLHIVDLRAWLDLTGPKFWSGQIWRLTTYPLLPAGILDFIMNGLALVMLGGILERHWTRGTFWCYCLLAASGAGLAKVILQSSSPVPLNGTTPMMLGLLIAWGFLCGREPLVIAPFGETTVWKLVLIAAMVSCLMLYFTAGPITMMIMAAGGFTGWLYLWLKHKWLMSRAGSVVHSERINRLEL